jgi:hypothetical protein
MSESTSSYAPNRILVKKRSPKSVYLKKGSASAKESTKPEIVWGYQLENSHTAKFVVR